MSEQAITKFVAMIAPVFPPPRHDDDDDARIWLAIYAKALAPFSAEVIAKAAETITLTRSRKKDGAFFPEPSECVAACEKAQRVLEAQQRPMLTVNRQPSGFSPDRHQLALDLLGTELGIEAVQARWHGALYDFAYRHARLPRGTEIDAVKRVSREFFRDVRACELGERGELSKPLARLGNAIARRRENWAKAHE
jgi:hypothetical protein